MRPDAAQAILEEPEGAAAAPARGRWWTALWLLAALAAGAATRLAAWPTTMTERGVRLAFDTDGYYHLLQAERLLAGRSVWAEPLLNWPFGQGVLWPPLWGAVVAGVARAAFGADASRDELALVAALLPVLVGLLTIAACAAIGGLLLGRGRGVATAFLVAILPPTVLWSSVGAADQHAAEVLLWAVIVLAFVAGWRAPSRRGRRIAAVALGVATAAAFWNWQGSALNLVVPTAFAVVVHLLPAGGELSDRVPRTLAAGLGVGAALLAASLALFGPPGALARGELSGVTALHVAMTAGAAGLAALLALARALRGERASALRRLAEVAVAAAAPAALALGAFPVLRRGVVHGLTALGAANPWYPEIAEYRHLVFSCLYPLTGDLQILLGTYGLTFVAAALAIPALVRRARSGEEGRLSVFFLACVAIPLLVLALVRMRFAPYLAVPLALLTAEGLWWTGTRIQARVAPGRRAVAVAAAAAAAAIVLAPTARALVDGVTTQPEGDVAAMRWLREQPAAPGREGVLATWDLGHLVVWFAGKPAVASPFGTDGSVDAMVDTARFDLSTDPAAAAELLVRRRIGFVVLSEPLPNAVMDQKFLGGEAPQVVTATCSAAAGRAYATAPAYLDGLAARLFYLDGNAGPGRRAPPIDGLRLVYESERQRIKIFGVVAGAALRVEGAPPGAEVTASLLLRTNQRRQASWSTSAIADGAGAATLRVPYATGPNGAVEASAALVRSGAQVVSVRFAEADVASGATARASF